MSFSSYPTVCNKNTTFSTFYKGIPQDIAFLLKLYEISQITTPFWSDQTIFGVISLFNLEYLIKRGKTFFFSSKQLLILFVSMIQIHALMSRRPSWPWSYGSWIYNYLCNQCLSLLTLWVRIPLRRGILDTTLCDKICQWLVTGQWFSRGTPVSSTNKTDCLDIAKKELSLFLT
jgi:hypothetical protein